MAERSGLPSERTDMDRLSVSDLLSVASKVRLVQGVESDLRDRRRAGLNTIVGTAIFQVVLAVSKDDYLSKLGYFLANLVTLNWTALFRGPEGLDGYAVIGVLILVAGSGTFFLLRSTRLLLRESEEPFQYTFSVDPFETVALSDGEISDASPKAIRLSQLLSMLHHDLIEKLNTNIVRLSLLDIAAIDKQATRDLGSHIHIRGHYALRVRAGGTDILQVMPRIRIGSRNQPEDLSPRVEVDIPECTRPEADVEACYRLILGQVYSRVATAIYQQIRKDIQKKIKLFPSRFLRAVGLFHEARDFERSNTVDAYDYAIDLYRQSLAYFEMRGNRHIANLLARRRGLWHLVRRVRLVEANARVAYARCLIYRNIVSALSGRTRNPLFHVPGEVKRAVSSLEVLYDRSSPRFSRRRTKHLNKSANRENGPFGNGASPSRYVTYPRTAKALRREPVFEVHRRALFEALCVWSLADSQMGAVVRASEKLRDARRLAPNLAESNLLYMLAESETRPNLHSRLQLLKKASDRAPSFEILSYRLAECLDREFRMRNELTLERAKPVLDAYEAVLRLNPGNVGAYAGYAYLQWLLEENDAAEKAYLEGLSVKTIRRQTFVGDLNYGLARIAAEEGRLDESFDRYRQALSSDPAVGVAFEVEGQSLNLYFSGFVDSMLERYARFSGTVTGLVTELREAQDPRDKAGMRVSGRTLGAVASWTQNDYGNACFRYHTRTGVDQYLDRAIELYRKATEHYPENAIAYFNLSAALNWKEGPNPELVRHLEKAEQFEPGWRALVRLFLEQSQAVTRKAILDKRLEKQSLERDIEFINAEIQNLEAERQSVRERERRERPELESRLEDLEIQRQDLLPGEGQLGQLSQQGLRVPGIKQLAEFGPKIAKLDREIAQIRDRQASHRTRDSKYEVRRGELEKKRNEKNLIVEEVEKSIDELNDAQSEQLLPRIHRLVQGSNLTAFLGSFKIEHLINAVPKFLKDGIRNDRLDPDSAETLRILAKVLSQSLAVDSESKLLERAAKLCRYVLDEFYPEDFGLTLALRDLCFRLHDTQGEIDALRVIRSSIMYSQQSDETNWNYLLWAMAYFDLTLPVRSSLDHSALGCASARLNDVGGIVRIPEALRSAFELYGIRLGRNSWVRRSPDGTSWEVTDRSDLAVYTVTQHTSEVAPIRIALDSGRRERSLRIALSNCQDIKDTRRVAVLHEMLAKLYGDTYRDSEAIVEYELAIENDPQQASYHHRLGRHHYLHARYRDAAQHYSRATGCDPSNPILFYDLSLAEEMCEDPESWDRASKALQSAIRLAPQDYQRYESRLASLRKKTGVADLVGYYNLRQMPIVTPFALEVAGDLMPLLETADENSAMIEDFAALLKDLRAEFEESFGVQIPGVRYRGNERDLPDGIYVIMINEIPLVSGTIRPNMTLVAETALDLGVDNRECEETSHPDTGEKLFWISEKEAERLADLRDDVQRWDPIEYLGWHLRVVLRRNLGEFFGHQETQNLLDTHARTVNERAGFNSSSLSEFTVVLRELLEEETPIRNVEPLVESYLASRSVSATLAEVGAEMRRLPEIKERLRGVEQGCTWYRLSDEIEAIIEAGMVIEAHASILALEPEPVQEILMAIRNNCHSNGPSNIPEAIVVQKRAIRRATRKLVELEFPGLWVVTKDELNHAAALGKSVLIELDK